MPVNKGYERDPLDFLHRRINDVEKKIDQLTKRLKVPTIPNYWSGQWPDDAVRGQVARDDGDVKALYMYGENEKWNRVGESSLPVSVARATFGNSVFNADSNSWQHIYPDSASKYRRVTTEKPPVFQPAPFVVDLPSGWAGIHPAIKIVAQGTYYFAVSLGGDQYFHDIAAEASGFNAAGRMLRTKLWQPEGPEAMFQIGGYQERLQTSPGGDPVFIGGAGLDMSMSIDSVGGGTEGYGPVLEAQYFVGISNRAMPTDEVTKQGLDPNFYGPFYLACEVNDSWESAIVNSNWSMSCCMCIRLCDNALDMNL